MSVIQESCSYCQINTAGEHEWNCPNNPFTGTTIYKPIAPAYVGWICPVCKRVNSPHVEYCPCEGKVVTA